MSHRAGLRACVLNIAHRFTAAGDEYLCVLHDPRNETYIACTEQERDAIQLHRANKPLRSVFHGTWRELLIFSESDQTDLFRKAPSNDHTHDLPSREQHGDNGSHPHDDKALPA